MSVSGPLVQDVDDLGQVSPYSNFFDRSEPRRFLQGGVVDLE
jgi:hypothetical protein